MIKEKIEEIEGERNDLYIFNEGHKLGFKKGKQEAQEKELEFLKDLNNSKGIFTNIDDRIKQLEGKKALNDEGDKKYKKINKKIRKLKEKILNDFAQINHYSNWKSVLKDKPSFSYDAKELEEIVEGIIHDSFEECKRPKEDLGNGK